MLSLRRLNENLKTALEADPTTAPAADAVNACEDEDPAGMERTAGLDIDPPKRPGQMESLTSLLATSARYIRARR
jgi:hypothetical protein